MAEKITENTRLPPYAPSEDLPQRGGEHYTTDTFSIDFQPVGVTDYYFTAPAEIVCFTTGGPMPVYCALDSDKVTSKVIMQDTIGFTEKGSQAFISAQQDHTRRLIAINYDPAIRQDIEAEMAQSPDKPYTANNIEFTAHSKLLSQMIQQFMTNGFQGGKLVAESLVVLSIVQTLESFRAPQHKRDNKVQSLSRQALSRTLEYIEVHLSHNISLEDLSTVAAVSQYHFSRCFKIATGMSPYQYVMDRRLEKAKCQLLATREKLSSIALSCGFSSSGHLSSTFVRRYGITPATVRKESL